MNKIKIEGYGPFLTVQEVAKILKKSPAWVRRKIRSGHLPAPYALTRDTSGEETATTIDVKSTSTRTAWWILTSELEEYIQRNFRRIRK